MQRYKLSLAVVTLSLFVTLNNCLSTTESHEWFCPLTGTGTLRCDETPSQTIFVKSAIYGQASCCRRQTDADSMNCRACHSRVITKHVRNICRHRQVCSVSLLGRNDFNGFLVADCTLSVSYICQIETTPTSRVKSTTLPLNKASTSQPVTSSTTTKSSTRQTAVTAVSNAMIDRQQTGIVIIVPGMGGFSTPSTVRPVQSTKRTTKATMITMFTVKAIALTGTNGRVPRRTLPSVPTDGGFGLRSTFITPGAPPGDNNLPVAIGAAVGGVVLLAAAIATVVIVMKRRRSPTPVPSSTPAPDVTAEPTYDSIREEEGGVQLGLSGATCSYSTIGQPNVTSESDRREAMYSKPDKNKAKTARNVEDLYAKPLKKESGEVENVLYESAGEFGVG
ncbi:Hypp5827 [Branchiostoma lanceolatum]|uniref:Hypp5827 protein n=1 Tax=Branchiostoma lanceolatum TaxID=7740 RepID=A0A8J9VFQ0_BRALA|nr:Hypp5827 [Branchiostoma lanceolatum]